MILRLMANGTFQPRVQPWVKNLLPAMQICVWLHLERKIKSVQRNPHLFTIPRWHLSLDAYQHGIWHFSATLNTHHPSLTFKASISETEINFLDTNVYKRFELSQTEKLDTIVFFKPTDTHQLLHTPSFIPSRYYWISNFTFSKDLYTHKCFQYHS